MPNLARDLILAGFWLGLGVAAAVLIRDTLARVRRANDELIARRLDGFSAALNPRKR